MCIIKIRQYFIALLLLQSLVSSGQQPEVEESLNEHHIGYNELQYIPAGDSIKDLITAKVYFSEGKYQKSLHPELNLGIAKDNYWVTFIIQNNSNEIKDYIINLGNPRLNDVQAFVLQNDSLIGYYQIGDNFPFYNRKIFQNQFAFPVHSDASETQRIFLYIRHKGNTLQASITMMESNGLLKTVEDDYMITGITTGVLLLTFFFALFFFFNSKTRLFFFYALYVLCLWAWLWSTEGFGFQYIYPYSTALANRAGPGMSVMSLVFFMGCSLEFCKPYENSSRLRKIISTLMIVLFFWGLMPFMPFINMSNAGFMKTFLSIHFILNISCIFLLITYLLWVSIRKNSLVWYYFTAVIITMGCSFIIVAKHSGLLDLPVTSGTFMSMGIIVELIVMTAGITRQLYSYKKEKEAALLANVEQQKSITTKILQMQDAERLRISRELHDDLGSGLTQITLIGEYAKQQLMKGHTGTEEMDNIAATSRQLVEKVSEIIWTMNPKNNSLAELLVYLREQIHKTLEYTAIEYTIDFTDIQELVTIPNEERRSIILLTGEIINNIIKHSKAAHVIVASSYNNDLFILKISDDGIGFDTTIPVRRNGLRNMRQRVEDIGGELQVTSEKDKGTTIVFGLLLKSHQL